MRIEDLLNIAPEVCGAEFPEEIRELVSDGLIVAPRLVGSTYINGHGEDIDYVCMAGSPSDLDFNARGWVECAVQTYEAQGLFFALRLGDLNLLVCSTREYYQRWVNAAEVCRYIVEASQTPISKTTRVHIHMMVMDDTPLKEIRQNG